MEPSKIKLSPNQAALLRYLKQKRIWCSVWECVTGTFQTDVRKRASELATLGLIERKREGRFAAYRAVR